MAIADPVFAFVLTDEHQRPVLAVSTQRSEHPTGSHAAGDEIDVAVGFRNCLAGGRYWISVQVSGPGLDAELLAAREDVFSFEVSGSAGGAGVLDLPHGFELTPAPSMQEAAGEH